MGGIVGGVALGIFIVGIAYFVWRDARVFRLPWRDDIDRRIERDSGAAHRPLSSIRDTLANSEKRNSRALWAQSQDALSRTLPSLRFAKLRGVLAQRDPLGLRLGVFMAFLLGLLAAGSDWSGRLSDGLTPYSIGSAQGDDRAAFTVIIDSPQYTALPQMVLSDKTIDGEVINIAHGSAIKVLMDDTRFGKNRVHVNGETHEFSNAFETKIDMTAGDLVIKRGFLTLGAWPYEVIADTPPMLEMVSNDVRILDDGMMGFAVSVKDDYGVQYLDMEVRLADVVADKPMIGEDIYIRRSVISPDGEDFEIAPVYDLSAHPWAGLPVSIDFTAVDELGQRSAVASISAQLPEREFQHPVAKTLVALRQSLIWNPLDGATYDKAAYDAHLLSTAKEMLHDDIVVYLALRSIALRLSYNEPSRAITDSVIGLMWDTALRVEDGDLSLSARKLRDAQAALEEALQDPNISESEISSLMQDLREAMGEYMSELAREMQKRMAEGEQFPMMPDAGNVMNQNALQDFMDQMEQAMRDGNSQSAQEMLSQMRRLMDMLNPSMQAQMPQDMQMMQQGVNALQELIERQELLLEQTEKQADLMDMLQGLGLNERQNRAKDAPSAPPFVKTEDNQTEQEALRFVLGTLMVEADEKIGEIPEAMGLAEVEMRGSSEALGFNDPLNSIPYQMRAIEYLKQSQDSLAEQLQQRMVQMTGFMLSFGGQRGMQRDPLGRPFGGENGANGDPYGDPVQIPDEPEQRRVQEILDLLRTRSGDGARPREERDYYRRLLRRF